MELVNRLVQREIARLLTYIFAGTPTAMDEDSG
jgi:hypothetical protein